MADLEPAPRVPPHQIIIVPPPDHEGRTALLQQCIQLRIDVFVTEQGFPLEVEVDECVILFPAPLPYRYLSNPLCVSHLNNQTDMIRRRRIGC